MAQPEIDAARLLLSRLGVTPEQLVDTATAERLAPTFSEYLPLVSNAVPAATRRVYETYWRRTLETWSERQIDEPTPLEITRLVERTRGEAVVRRNSRGGVTAAEHMVGALRCMYRYAEADGLISEKDNPARRVPKPRRLTSTRRALPPASLGQINAVAATTGNDQNSTPCCYGCTRRPPAGVVERSRCNKLIWTPTSVLCSYARRAARSDGNPSRPP